MGSLESRQPLVQMISAPDDDVPDGFLRLRQRDQLELEPAVLAYSRGAPAHYSHLTALNLQSTNQSIDQKINQSIERSVNQSIKSINPIN